MKPARIRAVVIADRLAELFCDVVGFTLPVRIRAWDNSEAGPSSAPVLVIRSRRALRRLLWAPGELGLARAYVSGDVDVDGDLADGFRLAWASARRQNGRHRRTRISLRTKIRAVFAAASLGVIGPPPAPPAAEARLTGRRHSRTRDRAAIAHHYDLSNEFYRLLLDEQMTYSSAYFTHDGQSLDEAQTAKLDLICRKLDLRPGMRLLDVGCGWGSLICYAAVHYGVHATGITLSRQQRDFIAGRLAESRVDNAEVRLADYRDFDAAAATRESFDAVSSVEMGEHVGEQQYPEYARMLFRALKPTGRLLLQQMSRRSDAAPGGGPFIERYIAPDMHMRPLAHTLSYLQNAGFEVRDVEAMREHYARTARHWIETLDEQYDQFVALLGEQAARAWRLYLVGGALAFEQGRMGVDQILAVKPTADGQAAMPWTRPWAAPPS
ncbi:SAM-dependent methyltransferase [Mycobacterium heckeshornense]|uniref:Cyclopropane-fatty-acyl-phospholipid synthase n=1 Tax=Mycobacterium heckeshornense TaxID=110505 RepID=A0A2I3F1A7_9MYCO|nr:cyclopropane-fatty-acyl-phospholipid synthase family protein [Mycobacterium heckeshornense]KMV24454.1 cyclopropane-fatty-acyl-phospholipid synthase [Mycobacterium heckeshornense]MCV7035521.1 class I SAM-dependent methyltransferase [Mycobacterium heckeshornense]BCO37881.1 cyclopropane-fatty-acyl-phospholipid synthase [Mycobacterium heckeshornense]